MKNIRLFLFVWLCALIGRVESQGFIRSYDLPGMFPYDVSVVNNAASTPDGGYLAIATTNNYYPWSLFPKENFLIKTDPEGDIQWFRKIDTPSWQRFYSDLFVTPAGNYAVALYDYSFNMDSSAYIRLYDPQGNKINERVFHEKTRMIMTDSGFLVCSSKDFTYKFFNLDWNADILSVDTIYMFDTDHYYLSDMVPTPDNGICLLTARFKPNGNGVYPGLVKISAQGQIEWQRFYAVEKSNYDATLAQNSDGQLFFSIRQWNNDTTAIVSVNTNGDSLWRADLRGWSASICNTADNGVAMMHVSSDATGFESWSLLKLNSSGNLVFEKNYVTNDNGFFSGEVELSADGGFLLSGAKGYKPTLIKTDAYGNVYSNFIKGKAVFDTNHNCLAESAELRLRNWIVSASKNGAAPFFTTTNTSGLYEFNLDTGFYTVTIQPPAAIWQPCDDGLYSVDLSTEPDTVTVNFLAQDSALCSLLDISLAAPRLVRCTDNLYYVGWCNKGTHEATDAMAVVVLPPELDFVSASQPVVQSGDTLYFELGTVGIGDCGQLTFTVYVDCDSTELGQTLCTEVHIYPDTLCFQPAGWSGAQVVATGKCLGDTTVEFRLRNIGNAPTQSLLNYIITEDLVVLMQGNYNLDPGEETVILRTANGATQRIEAEQEPGYPFASSLSAAVEACGTPPFSYNVINQYPLDDASPFTDIDCSPIVGSYDPNDKQGFPTGYDGQHFIEPGTDITYLIRFQNTGTDTAFTVAVRDTLSPWLDPASAKPGAASHPYSWELTGAGTLIFHFANILLPDSNVNEAASHGFVQFRVSQKTKVPLGTVIENDAAIVFDYNAPVITNTTFHTVDRYFYTVSTESIPGDQIVQVKVSPNPFRERATFTLPILTPEETSFRLLDAAGRLVYESAFEGNTLELTASGLHSGMYWIEIRNNDGALVARGKMIRN